MQAECWHATSMPLCARTKSLNLEVVIGYTFYQYYVSKVNITNVSPRLPQNKQFAVYHQRQNVLPIKSSHLNLFSRL